MSQCEGFFFHCFLCQGPRAGPPGVTIREVGDLTVFWRFYEVSKYIQNVRAFLVDI